SSPVSHSNRPSRDPQQVDEREQPDGEVLRIKDEFPAIADGVAEATAPGGVDAEADAVFAAPGLGGERVFGSDRSERAAPPDVEGFEREGPYVRVVVQHHVAAIDAEDHNFGAVAVQNRDEG